MRNGSSRHADRARSHRASVTPNVGGVAVKDIRFASGREVPAGTEVRVRDVGRPDIAEARICLPGMRELVNLGPVRFVDGVVLLPDARVHLLASF